MHVAGADLKTICILLDHGEIARIHDFGDNRQAGSLTNFSALSGAFLSVRTSMLTQVKPAFQLKDMSLFRQQCYIDGEWVDADDK